MNPKEFCETLNFVGIIYFADKISAITEDGEGMIQVEFPEGGHVDNAFEKLYKWIYTNHPDSFYYGKVPDPYHQVVNELSA